MLFVFQKGSINSVVQKVYSKRCNGAMRYNFLRQFQVRQYAEYGKWTHEPFLKSAYCAHQNRSIARGSVGPEICTWVTGALHDIFGQIYPNLSVLPHHFHIPCLHFCFLISMVRLYSNEWTGNLSVLLFVALLLSELNGEAWTYQGCPGGHVPPGKFEI